MKSFIKKELNIEKNEFMLIDTHAHVNFSAFKEDAEAVIKRAFEKKVFFINVGSQYSTSVRALKYAQKYPGKLWAAVGVHPVHLQAKSFTYEDNNELEKTEITTSGEEVDMEKYRELGKNKEVVAIGEVGLDYHHFEPEDDIEKLKNKQKEIFSNFIDLANELEKPMAIHCWGVKSRKDLDHARTDGYDDLYAILQNKPVKRLGVIHSFIGGYKTANKFIELGFLIGLNGVITYSDSFDRLVKEVPLEKILVETDCPYLTPVPKKGERNEPLYVAYVAEKISKIKQITAEKVAEITTQNAKSIFHL